MFNDCMCGHTDDEHDAGFFRPCSVNDCECEDYEAEPDPEDEDDDA